MRDINVPLFIGFNGMVSIAEKGNKTQVMCRWAGAVINRSPKGNMWSATPVALLCMIVNWSERKQGSGPERG